MKRIITLFAAAATLFSCSHDEAFTPNTPTEKATYYASFADTEGDSRTYLDEEFKLLWHNDDRISLFTTTYNEEYKFADPTGSNAGKFEAIDNDSWVTGNPVSTNYAVYPYNEHNALSNSEILTIHFPAEQAYAEKSFGRGANTMVAAAQNSTSRLLPFRNAGGYLMLKLYGEGAVKSITLEGNNEEILSGAATAQAKYGYLPLITMGNEGGKTITLTCEEAVELGATEAEATVFWLVVPPITFEEGFTITVTDEHGGIYTKFTSKEVVIERNEIKSMSALNATFEGQTEDPEVTENMMIRYVASAKVTPNVTSSSAFGANIISNEWDEATGKGVITFDGEVTKIGRTAFSSCKTLTSIIVPESVTLLENEAFAFCSMLKTVYLKPLTPPSTGSFENKQEISWQPFFNTSAGLIVSEESFDEYITVQGWRLYAYFYLLEGEKLTDHSRINDRMIWYTNTDKKYMNFSWDSNNWGGIKVQFQHYDTYNNIGVIVAERAIKTIPAITYNGSDYKSCSTFTLPASLTEVTSGAFKNAKVEEFYGPLADDGNQALIIGTTLCSYADFNYASTYTIPTGVTAIGDYAFQNSYKLTSVTIPDSVESIGKRAFEMVNDHYYPIKLAKVNIGSGMKSIGDYAFNGCNALKEVWIKALIAPTHGEKVFNMLSDSLRNLYIYVHFDVLWTEYKEKWSEYLGNFYGTYNFEF